MTNRTCVPLVTRGGGRYVTRDPALSPSCSGSSLRGSEPAWCRWPSLPAVTTAGGRAALVPVGDPASCCHKAAAFASAVAVWLLAPVRSERGSGSASAFPRLASWTQVLAVALPSSLEASRVPVFM